MDKKSINRPLQRLLIALLTLIISDSLIKTNNNISNVSKITSASLVEIQETHDSINGIFIDADNIVPSATNNSLPAIYLFLNDSLIYWSSNINEPNILKEISSDKNIIRQANNTFYVTCKQNDSLKILLSTPLYRDNPNIPDDNKFLPENINGNYNLNFSINNDDLECQIDYIPKMNDSTSFILTILLFYILVLSYKIIFRHLQNTSNLKAKFLVYFLCSSCIYALVLFLQKFLFLSTSDIFNISCLLPDCRYSFSLAVLGEFSVFFLFNVIALSKNLHKKINLGMKYRILLSTISFIFILLTYTYLIVRLISNINIHFTFLQIYSTNVFSYIFLIIICVLTSSIIILLQNVMNLLVNERFNYLWALLCFMIIGILSEIIFNKFISLNYSLVTNILGIVIYLIIIWEKKSTLKVKSIIRNIVIITSMSIQLTYILYLINETKEKEEMSWFATIIGDESDQSLEEEILKVIEQIKKDELIIKWQKNNDFPSDDSVLCYFENKYFLHDNIKDYSKTLTICDTNTILIIRDIDDYEVNCNSLFNAIFDYNKTINISEELSQIDDPTTDAYYILKLDLSPIDSNYHNVIYIEFYKEYILNYIGIPEILNSHGNVITPNLHNYSFASYHDGILQYKYGHYNYPNELDNFRHKNEEYVKTRIFKHLVKKFDDEKTSIVTIEKPRFIDVIAPFSYIFIMLMIMYYINMAIERRHDMKIARYSFHGKMQIVILMTLGFSFFVVGLTSFLFMRNSLNNNNLEFLYEKNKSIINNLESAFDKQVNINDASFLKNLKDIYFTDINIYDTNGILANTTQPKLFDGFKSGIINRDAYEAIVSKNRFYYSTQEKIDDTEYNSSYFPLRDNDGNRIAIINIPYYEQSNVSKSNMSYFIITYLNIILVLMGLSGLVVILMTRRTIKPLQMIQDRMQKISLGDKNEPIEWYSDDEIGDLIEIYNKLIKELEVSANQLMRSERETAWREMARQVAHEIKNPLTPMKLNIQFLQMAWDENNPDIDRKMKETTSSLLEQIEILSNIATAFSDYAKLPKNNMEHSNIKEILINTINLYDNHQNIRFDLTEENESDYLIYSDKNNLGIVFGNIVKNAIQAIGKKENGIIAFKIKDLSTKYHIEISDNGCGIREEEKKKIFMPNFTTKSSGMGVGLSIVYDILQTLNGEISFNSEYGVGTTFIIEIKK